MASSAPCARPSVSVEDEQGTADYRAHNSRNSPMKITHSRTRDRCGSTLVFIFGPVQQTSPGCQCVGARNVPHSAT